MGQFLAWRHKYTGRYTGETVHQAALLVQGQAEHEGGRVQVREELRARGWGGRGRVVIADNVCVCVSVSYRYHKRVRLKLDTWILIPLMDEMVNDNGHGQRFVLVMCLFVSCYHFFSKGKRGGERKQCCVLLCKSPTGETLLLPLTKGGGVE